MTVPESHLDPEWLAHRYQPDGDAFHFVAADRAARSDVAFLTEELLGSDRERRVLPRSAAERQRGNAPVHFIFHSAYCCSTLLARVFDMPGQVSSLKEPQLLNDLVGWRHQGAAPDRVSATVDLALGLLQRPHDGDTAMVIKPSNVINGLLPSIMAMRPDARAILLYAPLPAYLASIARKGMWGRLWARELLSRQLVDGLVAPFNFSTRDHILHTDLQAAAVSWLAQHKLFTETARRWPDRVRTLNSEVLVAKPAACVARIVALYGLNLSGDIIDAQVAAEFSRDAKDGAAFGAGQREQTYVAARQQYEEELEKVGVWAEAVAGAIGLSMDAPAPLLG